MLTVGCYLDQFFWLASRWTYQTAQRTPHCLGARGNTPMLPNRNCGTNIRKADAIYDVQSPVVQSIVDYVRNLTRQKPYENRHPTWRSLLLGRTVACTHTCCLRSQRSCHPDFLRNLCRCSALCGRQSECLMFRSVSYAILVTSS